MPQLHQQCDDGHEDRWRRQRGRGTHGPIPRALLAGAEDGCEDGQEDSNRNGKHDESEETDPNNPDTDGDGFSDCDELSLQTDPLDSEDFLKGKYGGSGCATVSEKPQAWTWLIGLIGLLTFRRKRK